MSDGQSALKRYLEEHALQKQLNTLLNELAEMRPSDPHLWIATKLDQLHTLSGLPASWPQPVDARHDGAIQQMSKRWDSVFSFREKLAAAPPASSNLSDAPATAPRAPTHAPAEPSAEPTTGSREKDAKKAAKAEEKRKKEEEKERRRREREEAEKKKLDGPEVPTVTLLDFEKHDYGNLFIQSHTKTERKWTRVEDLASGSSNPVWMRVRLHHSRKQSAKLGFVILRQRLATVQAVVQGKDMASFLCGLPKESVLDMLVSVVAAPTPITACSRSDVELQVVKAFCVSRAATKLPLQLEDAGRSEAELASLGLPRVEQATRLDNRVIDLRTPANQAIFRLQSKVCELFRSNLLSQGFVEIHSPKMIATASEGGADVFRLGYFGGKAYLAQSPQLYKQMALMADLGRVFEIGPVFRSEKSLTHRHMTEFVGLDMEMTFKDSYHEVLSVLEETFLSIFDGLNASCQTELAAVNRQYPFNPLRYSRPALRMHYREAVQLLREHGPAIGAEQLAALEAEQAAAAAAGDEERSKDMLQLIADEKAHLATVPTHKDDEDLSTKDEKLLGAVVAKVKGQDFYVIDKFPTSLRPFYTMPDPKDPAWSNSYDIFIRGEEVTSGAQRIHDSAMLLARGEELGVDLTPIKDYVDSFRYGAFPHAGGGVGLERVVMLFCALNNIRKTSLFPRDPNRLLP